MDFSETRRHQEDKPLTGAVEKIRRLGLIRPRDFFPSPPLRRAARCWPSAGLRGDQWRCHRKFLWTVRGRWPLRGYRGPGRSVAPQSSCPRFLSEQGSHLPYTPRDRIRWSRHVTIRKVPGWHVRVEHRATEVAVHALLDGLVHWGPPCSGRPRKYSVVTGALGRWPRGHVKKGTVPAATGITPSGGHNEGQQG